MTCRVILTLTLLGLTFVHGTELLDEGKSGSFSEWIDTLIDYHEKVLSKQCVQTRGIHSVHLIREKSHDVVNCIESEWEPGKLLINFFNASSDENSEVGDFCDRLLGNYEKCWNPFVSALKGCTQIEGDHDLDDVTSMLYEGVHFACADQGKRISDLLLGNGLDCVIEFGEQLLNCSSGLDDLLRRVDYNYSVFSKDGCRIQWSSYECITETLSQCADQGLFRVWREMISLSMEKTRCASISSSNGAACPSIWTWLSMVSVEWILFVTYEKIY